DHRHLERSRGELMTAITTSTAEAGKVCPYCRFPLKEGSDAERCDACQTVHHAECWRDGAGCAVLGCANAGSESAVERPPAPARREVEIAASQPGRRFGLTRRRLVSSFGVLAAAAGVTIIALLLTGSHSSHEGQPPSPISKRQALHDRLIAIA